MYLNTLKPAEGSKKKGKRLGRGIGSGKGKTCGKGHKGALARAGGGRRLGFEGGQMPQQRRIPKSGFNSKLALVTDEIRLHELAKLKDNTVSLASLQAAGLITSAIKHVKIFAAGEINAAYIVDDANIRVTRGAKQAIEAAGGKVVTE